MPSNWLTHLFLYFISLNDKGYRIYSDNNRLFPKNYSYRRNTVSQSARRYRVRHQCIIWIEDCHCSLLLVLVNLNFITHSDFFADMGHFYYYHTTSTAENATSTTLRLSFSFYFLFDIYVIYSAWYGLIYNSYFSDWNKKQYRNFGHFRLTDIYSLSFDYNTAKMLIFAVYHCFTLVCLHRSPNYTPAKLSINTTISLTLLSTRWHRNIRLSLRDDLLILPHALISGQRYVISRARWFTFSARLSD